MTAVKNIIDALDQLAPPGLQESYDNSGLITGQPEQQVTGVLICLDVVPEVIEEAVTLGCNLIVSHHPPVFSGLKRFTGRSLSEKIVIQAIRNDIALFACHTNLDSVPQGVSGALADKLGLVNRSVLVPRNDDLLKLVCFIPKEYADAVSEAIFDAGAGTIGHYDQCSFQAAGIGTFRAGPGTHPFSGTSGEQSREPEIRFETVFPAYLEHAVLRAMKSVHPYEEIAFDLYPLRNENPAIGLGIAGDLKEPIDTRELLSKIKVLLGLPSIRHSRFFKESIQRIAICGGSGSGFISQAARAGCDAYLTADCKYHQWFEVPESLMLIDIGHYESEQFAMTAIFDTLIEKFPKFAVRLTEVNTNPINYY